MPSVELPGLDHFVVHAGWLIDGSGGPVKSHPVVEIKSGVILSITPGLSARDTNGYPVSAAGGPPVVDAGDCLMLPGLIDSHVHLAWSATPDPQLRAQQFFAPYPQARERILANLRDSLRHGVIALRDGGDHHGHLLRFKLEEAPLHRPIPLIRACGKAVFRQGRYGRIIGEPVSLEQVLVQRIRCAPERRDHLKIVNSGLNSLTVFGRETAGQFDVETLRTVVSTARKRGLKVMVHANGRKPVMDAVLAGCDSIEHGFFMGAEALSLMARTGTVWVPTAVTMKALSEALGKGSPEADMARRNLDHQLQQVEMARRLGVNVAVGTDAGGVGVFHGMAVLQEMCLLISAGFRLEEAVRCATKNGASLLGIEDEGVLMPGKAASFILVRGPAGDCSKRIEPPEAVYVRGKMVHSRKSHENERTR